MNTEAAKEHASDLLRETGSVIRANPVPALITALGVGLAIRLLETPERKSEPLREALDELRDLLATGAKRGKRAYADSAEAVRDAVEHVVEKARDLDTDPVANWWKRLWS